MMMTSNILARFRSTTEPAAASIYETIRQHDDHLDGSDLEEQAGFAIDRQNLEEDLHDFDPSDVRGQSSFAEDTRGGPQRVKGKQRATSPKLSRRYGRTKKSSYGPDLVDVEEADDDVPASLLIEGAEGLLPHEIENLPLRPSQTSPNGQTSERARVQWAQAQAAQELHPAPRATSTRQTAAMSPAYNALAMAHPKEKAMWRWANVQNLDNFLYDVYNYYLNHGFWSIILQRAINLLTVALIIGLFLFLTQCIDYRKIKGSTQLPEILVPHCTRRMGFLPNALLWVTTFVWIFKVYQYIIDIRRLLHLHDFYYHLLGIPEEEIQSISWQEIVSRLMALRDSNPNISSGTNNKSRTFLGTQSKQRMDAHDIANRLMRRENYMVAMVNKDILDMTLPIPGLRNKQLFTRTLEWNLDYCITQFVFTPQGQVHQLFLKDTHRQKLSDELKRRFVFAGVMNLIIAPFLISYFVLENFFQYFNEYQKNPAQIGIRRYNVLAEWKFREFNELWHLFQRRLNMSHPFAMRYINQFPKEKTIQAARFVAFVSGAIVSILGLATILDQENFLGFEISPGRTTIFYLGVFGGIWAVARGMLPDDNMVYDSSFSMEEVIEFTHYRPASWEGRLHTVDVKTDFARLYQMQVVIFMEEVLSMIFTPFVLWFSLPKCSDQIIDFFREFTVHVDGLGYVCSFAEFNLQKPGNTVPSGNNIRAPAQNTGIRDDYFATKDQKLEQSYWGFMNDYARNPKTDVRFPYRETTLNRRRFNMPPPFPGMPSPQLNPNFVDTGNAANLTNIRQSHLFSPHKAFGFQSTASKFAGQIPGSPLQSLLLDPHHLPPSTGQFPIGSIQTLPPRASGPSASVQQQRLKQSRTVPRTFSGPKREDTTTTTITEDPDVPPDDLTGEAHDGVVQADVENRGQPTLSQQQTSLNTHSEVMGSWNRPGEDADDDDTDEHEDDVAALIGERAGVLGLIKQFQRAQGASTRTGTDRAVVQVLTNHKELLLDFFSHKPQPPQAKNTQGDVISDADVALQKTAIQGFQKILPNYFIVGEEEIEGYNSKFPERIDENAFYAAEDIIDGSANYRKASLNWATTFGIQHGRKTFFGVVCVVSVDLKKITGVQEYLIIGGSHGPTTINHNPVGPFKTYDVNNIHLAYGLGKIKSQTEQDAFEGLVKGVAKDARRPGCASISILEVLLGLRDAYVSLKEAWTNIAPLYEIAKNAGLVVNVDPATLDLNMPFYLSVATPEFATRHLQPDSILAKCLANSGRRDGEVKGLWNKPGEDVDDDDVDKCKNNIIALTGG